MIEVDQGAPARKLKFYQILYVQVLFAIVIGILLGYFKPDLGQAMQPLGDGFIKLVKMIIAPVIFLTVATGIAAMSDLKKVGRVAGKAMLYFLVFSTLALIVGMVVSHIVQPGAGMHINPATLDQKAVSGYVAKAHDSTITGFLLNVIPTTIFSPFVGGDILQVLFVAVLFGIALAQVGERGKPVLDFLTALAQPIFKLVAILMKAAPIGAFGAMAFTIGKYGIKSIINLAMLVGTFYATSVLFVVVVLGLVARYNGFSILKLVRYIREELLLVLGTSSSEAALPTLMQKMERAGCSKSVVGLVVPTGYSFNLDGTNIYMTMAALFIAQACDIPLSLGDQILLLLVAMLSSKGRRGRDGRRLHHPGRDAVGGADGAGGRHGADPGRGPLHVGMPRADQPGRQRHRRGRGGALGRRVGQGPTACGARRRGAGRAAAGDGAGVDVAELIAA